MKIEIKYRAAREFYDELYYVAIQKRKLEKGQKLKTGGISSYYRYYLYLGIFGMAFTLVSYFIFRNELFFLMFAMMAFLTALMFKYNRGFKKNIDSLMNLSGTRTIEIDEKGVKFHDEAKSLDYKWEDILKVVFGKYSICFIPKKDNEYLVAVEEKYRDGVMEVLKENGLLDKAVDNI